jgi:outer membrane protein assembly factor BamB
MRSSEIIRRTLLVVSLAISAAGCGSGGSGGCKLSGGTTLALPPSDDAAGSDWPKFHRDEANTGRIEAPLVWPAGTPRRVFPPPGMKIGAISTTPILGPNQIFFGSQDGTVYAIDPDGNPLYYKADTSPPEPEHLGSGNPVTASPLLGDNHTLFVADGDGTLVQYSTNDGFIRKTSAVGGFLSASPNIGGDGTIYLGSLSGAFGGICPNGAARFLLIFSPAQAAPAVTTDPDDPQDRIIINAEESGQVRGFDIRGRQRWSFFASAGVKGAVVVDEAAGRFFVADSAGRVFSASVRDGRRQGVCSEDSTRECAADGDCTGECVLFAFRVARCAGDPKRPCASDEDCAAPASCIAEAVTAAPALGSDTLYVVSEEGTLFALDSRTAALRFLVAVDARVLSSPAVALSDGGETVVFGADDGFLYAVRDGEMVRVSLGAAVGASSPSIASDGTIYIGTTDGVLYAVDGA